MKQNVVIAVLLMFNIVGCIRDYSSGERAGVITKFSQKGYLFKTWEGELLMGGMKMVSGKNGESAVANIFEFSVDADHFRNEDVGAIADTIKKALDLGLAVKMHYNQEAGCSNCNCARGETNHFIDKVKIEYSR